MWFRLVSPFAAAAFAPPAALAQSAPEGRLAAPSIDASTLLGLGGSLVLVIAAILFAGWAYSRMRGLNTAPSTLINVLAARPLGPKERIVLVQIGDKQLALGLTQGSLNTLHVFDEPVIAVPESMAATPFARRLRSAFAAVKPK